MFPVVEDFVATNMWAAKDRVSKQSHGFWPGDFVTEKKKRAGVHTWGQQQLCKRTSPLNRQGSWNGWWNINQPHSMPSPLQKNKQITFLGVFSLRANFWGPSLNPAPSKWLLRIYCASSYQIYDSITVNHVNDILTSHISSRRNFTSHSCEIMRQTPGFRQINEQASLSKSNISLSLYYYNPPLQRGRGSRGNNTDTFTWGFPWQRAHHAKRHSPTLPPLFALGGPLHSRGLRVPFVASVCGRGALPPQHTAQQ